VELKFDQAVCTFSVAAAIFPFTIIHC
jgi:hypothetical protein